MKYFLRTGIIKNIMLGAVISGLIITSLSLQSFSAKTDSSASEKSETDPVLVKEITSERTRFTKKFLMSDGSFVMATYSMPVHYKKNGVWKEIDTSLQKSGKKSYKTKSSELQVKVAKKSVKSKKSALLTMKRDKLSFSLSLFGKNLKNSKAITKNPSKSSYEDVSNHSTVSYKKILKNTDITYDIFPEKVQEIITVNKKGKAKSFSFKVNTKIKVQVKGKKVYFKNKKGKTKFTRMNTVLTDAGGVSTSKVKISYNKKKKLITIKPDKSWWNSKKRKFPLEIKASYLTNKHERDVKVGAAYTGAPDSNYGYDKTLLLQSGKCSAFVKMNRKITSMSLRMD